MKKYLTFLNHKINSLLRNESDRFQDETNLHLAVLDKNWSKIEDYFENKHDHKSLVTPSRLAVSLAKLGDLEFFKKFESYVKNHMNLEKDFYKEVLLWSFARDNKEIISYMLEEKKVNQTDFPFNFMITLANNKSEKLIDFIIHDLNYAFDQSTIDQLRSMEQEDSSIRITSEINKRDLTARLQEIDFTQTNVVNKKLKL